MNRQFSVSLLHVLIQITSKQRTENSNRAEKLIFFSQTGECSIDLTTDEAMKRACGLLARPSEQNNKSTTAAEKET